ncbi:MAG: molecular chaperone TorD family protein [Caldilineales bacterium]|nr:molecular chaperone TorD family protein [Caldilineales bacterium]MCW5860141.1 molecular chaperone TorD family protein [Caldilineales bacterium]
MYYDMRPGQVLHLFAQLLDYPRGDLRGVAAQGAALAADRSPTAAATLREFESFVSRTPLTRLEELYTSVFELDATCHPYIGYHLFGESYKRSSFLLGLKDRYRPYNVDCGVELPDHLAVILCYLAVHENWEECQEIITEGLHPALHQMLHNHEDDPPDPAIPKQTPPGEEYRQLLQALYEVLLTMAPDLALPVASHPVNFLFAAPCH